MTRFNWPKNRTEQKVARDSHLDHAEDTYYFLSKKKKPNPTKAAKKQHIEEKVSKEIQEKINTNKILKLDYIQKSGTYVLPYVEQCFIASGFDSRSEYVKWKKEQCLKEQNTARSEKPTKYDRLPIGKYKNMTWREVLNKDEKYILWFYWSIHDSYYQTALLQWINVYSLMYKSFELYR